MCVCVCVNVCMSGIHGSVDLFSSSFDDFIAKLEENCQLSTEDLFPKMNDVNGEQDPKAVFNVLDSMLKESLDRLKTMR